MSSTKKIIEAVVTGHSMVKVKRDLKHQYRHLDRPRTKLEEADELNKTTPSIEQVAAKHKASLDDVKSALDAGIKVEMEHTKDRQTAEEIALDHLNEDPNYYKKLKKMVEQFENMIAESDDCKKMKSRDVAKYLISKKKQTNEELEQIAELKKSTLQSYTAKAIGSKEGADFMRGVKMGMGSGDRKSEEELRAKSIKRSEGIHRAIKKLAEEINLSEMKQGKEYTQKELMDKIKTGNWEATHDIKPGKHVEMRHHSGKRVMVKVAHVNEGFENLPGKATHILNKDARHSEHGIVQNGTVLRKTGEDTYEIRAGRAKGQVVKIGKEHVNKIEEGYVPAERNRPALSDSDKNTLGKVAALMAKEKAKKAEKQVKEDVEQIDEISKMTAREYLVKAGQQIDKGIADKEKREKRIDGYFNASTRLADMKPTSWRYKSVKEEAEQIDEISDELAMKVGKARTAAVNKATDEYRATAFQPDHVRSAAYDKIKAAEAKRSKGGKVHIARSDRKFKSFMKQHAEKMAARSPEQVKKDTEAEIADKHKNYKERGWTLD